MAKAVLRQYPKAIVHVLEKEKMSGMHTSGRNSGVIHAGIYYSSDSLKAKFCKVGNQRLTKYCIDNKVDILKCGKFIVASNEKEYEYMYEIFNQGIANGIDVQLMSREQAQKKEPLLRGYGQDVIWSPTTSVANSKQLISKISDELKSKPTCSQFYDVEILKIDRTIKGDQIEIATKDFLFESKYLINWAGQHALDIANKFQIGLDYKMLPVKGNYLISDT